MIPSWLLLEVTPQREFGSPTLSNFAVHVREARTGTVTQYQDAADFKGAYALLDTHGAHLAEPPQRIVEAVERLKRRKHFWLGLDCGVCCTVFGLAFVSFVLVHFYACSCYRGFMRLKILQNHSALPTWEHPDVAAQVLVSCDWTENDFEAMLFEDLSRLLQKARGGTHHVAKRTSAFAGKVLDTDVKIPTRRQSPKVDRYKCRPDVKATECGDEYPGSRLGSQRPTFLEEYMPVSVRCLSGSCSTHKLIDQVQHYALFITIAWTVLFLGARHFMDDMIEKRCNKLHGKALKPGSKQLRHGPHGAEYSEVGTSSPRPTSPQAFSGRSLC